MPRRIRGGSKTSRGRGTTNPFNLGQVIANEAIKKQVENAAHGAGMRRRGRGHKRGGDFWSDFQKGFNMVWQPASQVLSAGLKFLPLLL